MINLLNPLPVSKSLIALMTKYYQVLLYALFMLCLFKKPIPFMQSKAKTRQRSHWLRLQELRKEKKKRWEERKKTKMYMFFWDVFFFYLNKKCDGLA